MLYVSWDHLDKHPSENGDECYQENAVNHLNAGIKTEMRHLEDLA